MPGSYAALTATATSNQCNGHEREEENSMILGSIVDHWERCSRIRVEMLLCRAVIAGRTGCKICAFETEQTRAGPNGCKTDPFKKPFSRKAKKTHQNEGNNSETEANDDVV